MLAFTRCRLDLKKPLYLPQAKKGDIEKSI